MAVDKIHCALYFVNLKTHFFLFCHLSHPVHYAWSKPEEKDAAVKAGMIFCRRLAKKLVFLR